MSFTSLQAYTSNFWYFDSGCSRHMTGDHNALINCEKCSREYITFVDYNVLHVENLKANLLSISQICDQNLMVNFDSSKCQVFNKKGEYILEGTRSSDHCYKLIQSITCHKATFDENEIWHQKFGHLNYKLLTKLDSAEIV